MYHDQLTAGHFEMYMNSCVCFVVCEYTEVSFQHRGPHSNTEGIIPMCNDSLPSVTLHGMFLSYNLIS